MNENEFVSRDEFNGLGERVTKQKELQIRHDERLSTFEQCVAEIKCDNKEIKKSIDGLALKMALIMGGIITGWALIQKFWGGNV